MFPQLLEELGKELMLLAKDYKSSMQAHYNFLTECENIATLALDDLPALDYEEKKSVAQVETISTTPVTPMPTINPTISTTTAKINPNTQTNTPNNTKAKHINTNTKAKPITYVPTKFTNGVLSDSVGKNAVNNPQDVITVRTLLNNRGYKVSNGDTCDEALIAQIEKFQADFKLKVDGVVGPYHHTSYALAKGRKASSEKEINYFRLEAIDPIMKAVAKEYNIDANLMKAICYHESRGEHQKGLMQVIPSSWNGIIQENPELAIYPYNPYHKDPQINLIFAAICLNKIKNSLKVNLGIDPSHEKYEYLTLAYYNAGSGTISEAINRAKKAGSTDPYTDCMQREFMLPAINKKIYNNKACEKTLETKYKEIFGYYPKVSGTLNEIRKQDKTTTPTNTQQNIPYTPTPLQTQATYPNTTYTSLSDLYKPQLPTYHANTPIDAAQIAAAYTDKAFIRQPVGENQTNNPNDVIVIKILLNKYGYMDIKKAEIQKLFYEYGICDNNTINQIKDFQRKVIKRKIDGIVHPNGETIGGLIYGSVIPENTISKKPSLVFVGDSIALGFHLMSQGEKIAIAGATPDKVLSFLKEAIQQYDMKNKVLCLSTGYANDVDERYRSAMKQQFDLIKQYGIRAKVFGVSLNNPDTDGVRRNNHLAALCRSVGAEFMGGFKGASAKDNFIHPSYYRIK